MYLSPTYILYIHTKHTYYTLYCIYASFLPLTIRTNYTLINRVITQEGNRLESSAPRPSNALTNQVSWRSEGRHIYIYTLLYYYKYTIYYAILTTHISSLYIYIYIYTIINVQYNIYIMYCILYII